MKEYSKPGFHPVALFFWCVVAGGPMVALCFMPNMLSIGLTAVGVGASWVASGTSCG